MSEEEILVIDPVEEPYPKYFISTTSFCQQKSSEKALERGCGPVTRYWWGFVKKWDDPSRSALVFTDSNIPVDCQPTVDFLPPDWYPPESPERAAAEERERGA